MPGNHKREEVIAELSYLLDCNNRRIIAPSIFERGVSEAMTRLNKLLDIDLHTAGSGSYYKALHEVLGGGK